MAHIPDDRIVARAKMYIPNRGLSLDLELRFTDFDECFKWWAQESHQNMREMIEWAPDNRLSAAIQTLYREASEQWSADILLRWIDPCAGLGGYDPGRMFKTPEGGA